MTFDPQNWRSVSYDPMPPSTGADYAAYFPRGMIDVEQTAIDNDAWIREVVASVDVQHG
jgi:hypothetical protein